MGEEDDEARFLLVENGTEGEVDLGKARGTPVVHEHVGYSHVWIRGHQEKTRQRWLEHTFVLYLALDTLLARPAKGILADQLEVICHVVHLLALQIRYDDEDLVAAQIMHAAQEHQFWQLRRRVRCEVRVR